MTKLFCKLRKVIKTWLSKKDDEQVKYLSGKKKKVI